MYIVSVSNVSLCETVSRRVLERIGLVSWHWPLGLETRTSPETSSTSRATFQPNTSYVKLKLQLSQISGSLDNALFILGLLKMTKLHSAISQHGLRSIIQPATPHCVHWQVQRGEGERKAGGPDYKANSKSAIQIQIVSTSFLKVKLKNKH